MPEERICQYEPCSQPLPSHTHGKVHKYCSKTCRNKTYRIKHPEEVHAYSTNYGRIYHALHREEQNAKHRAYNAENSEKLNAASARRYVAKREEISAKHRTYYEANKEKRGVQIKAYRKEHPEVGQAASSRRRARMAAAPINDLTSAQWETIKRHYNYCCAYCPDTCWRCRQKKHKLTIDHVTPVSKGGSHTMSNIVPACSTCNKRKNAGPPLKPVPPLLLLPTS